MGRSHTKPGENLCKLFKSKNKIRCSAPFQICIKRVVEAKQNQERIHAANCSKVRIKSDVPLRFGVVLSELWKPNKTRSCGKEAIQNQERIHANCSKVRMKSDVPFRFGSVLSELWKPNKTRSCRKEAAQNHAG